VHFPLLILQKKFVIPFNLAYFFFSMCVHVISRHLCFQLRESPGLVKVNREQDALRLCRSNKGSVGGDGHQLQALAGPKYHLLHHSNLSAFWQRQSPRGRLVLNQADPGQEFVHPQLLSLPSNQVHDLFELVNCGLAGHQLLALQNRSDFYDDAMWELKTKTLATKIVEA